MFMNVIIFSYVRRGMSLRLATTLPTTQLKRVRIGGVGTLSLSLLLLIWFLVLFFLFLF